MEILGERLLQDFNAKINANKFESCGGSLSWDKFGNLHNLSLKFLMYQL